MSTLQDILARRSKLKNSLEEITEISKKAFAVFSVSLSLSEFKACFDESWNELISYQNHQENNPINAYLSWEHGLYYNEIRNIFDDVTDARIDRDVFTKKLEPVRTAVKQYIEKAEAEIAGQDKELEQLYDDFTQNCGDFAPFFAIPHIKELVFKHFLQI